MATWTDFANHFTKFAAQRAPCIICGARPWCCGVWIPNEEHQKIVYSPKYKLRTLWYTLCRKCHRKKDTTDRVEKILIARVMERESTN